MIIDLFDLNINGKKININGEVNIPLELLKGSSIRRLDNVCFQGYIDNVIDDNYELCGTLSGDMILPDDITLEDEQELFKIYLPNEQVDYYGDYDNYNNQDMFYTKRINYEKNNIKQDVVSKILKKACNLITDFKLSVIDKKIKCFENNKLDCIAIFNYMIGKKENKLKTYYKVAKKEGATYNSYNDFIKSVVYYGANHIDNNRFWREIKRELY